jgi:hypothetical protein
MTFFILLLLTISFLGVVYILQKSTKNYVESVKEEINSRDNQIQEIEKQAKVKERKPKTAVKKQVKETVSKTSTKKVKQVAPPAKPKTDKKKPIKKATISTTQTKTEKPKKGRPTKR